MNKLTKHGLIATVAAVMVFLFVAACIQGQSVTATGEKGQRVGALPVMPSMPGDEAWDDRFGLTGLDGGLVYDVATIGNDVYVAGTFTTAGNVTVNNIA